jgi:hypothetical protein
MGAPLTISIGPSATLAAETGELKVERARHAKGPAGNTFAIEFAADLHMRALPPKAHPSHNNRITESPLDAVTMAASRSEHRTIPSIVCMPP